MKALCDLRLTQQLQDALLAARDRITAQFDVHSIVLFGSVVRGSFDEESDVDLLIVLGECPDHRVRNRISSLLLDINLEYGTNFSGLVVD